MRPFRHSLINAHAIFDELALLICTGLFYPFRTHLLDDVWFYYMGKVLGVMMKGKWSFCI